MHIKVYIEHVLTGQQCRFPLSPAAVHSHAISPFVEMQETMMTGLRLTREGVSVPDFNTRFGHDLMDVFGREVNDLLRLGLLEWTQAGQILRLTVRGRLVGNQVFMRFVG